MNSEDRRQIWLEAQMKRLGRMVLDLQAQTTQAYHSARRFETVASLVGEVSNASRSQSDAGGFDNSFLRKVSERLHVDLAALLTLGPNRRTLVPIAVVGPDVRMAPFTVPIPDFCYSSSLKRSSPFVSDLIAAAGFRFVLWAWDSESEVGLLLANELETRDFYDQFGEQDQSTISSALRVYLDTRWRREAEAALHRRLAQARALNHISTTFIHLEPGTFQETALAALGSITRLMGADRGSIYLVNPEEDTIRRAYVRDDTAAFSTLRTPTEFPLHHAGALLLRLRREEVLRVHRGGSPSAADAPFLTAFHESQAHSALFVPVVFRQGLEAFFAFLSERDLPAWADPDVTFLRTVASVFASAIAAHRDRSERDQLQSQIQQAQKLNSLGVLAGGIAHDFNNILTPILSGLELAQLQVRDRPKVAELMTSALAACERARRLVQQILLFSRKNAVQRRPVEVGRVLTEATDLLRASLPATIAIECRLKPDSQGRALTVVGDGNQLGQVLVNLGTNAWQAMAGGKGSLRLLAGVLEIGENDTTPFPMLGLGTFAHISVTDTGPGIPEHVQPHIFDPFFTTKPSGKGTGMGLAVVHGIVSDHGGSITFWTGKSGTTFHIFLPLSGSAVENTDVSLPALALRGTEGVLVVDDEPEIAWRVRQMLVRLGYHAVAVTSPSEALTALEEAPQNYHLLLTDFTMPEMTGLELAHEAIRLAGHLRILLCTGYHEPLGPEQMQKARIAGTVHKPFRYTDLARQVRTVLDSN